MPTGTVYPSEEIVREDRFSGVRVRQLTNGIGHSNHAYFTHPNWYDGGRRLLFVSDRANARNLFSIEIESGEITQITDTATPGAGGPLSMACHHVAINPARPEAYFRLGRRIFAVTLDDCDARPIFDTPDGFKAGNISVTADGEHLCFVVNEDLSGRIHQELNHGYIGMRDVWKAAPHSRILRLSPDGGEADCVWEEKCWIGHVNTSPTRADRLSFCHEGPWIDVDHRIWGLDLGSGRAWKIRPLDRRGRIGHEYWLADGERIGYHGSWPPAESGPGASARPEMLIGCIREDNTGHIEFAFPHATGHTHSLDFVRIVGDGGGAIRIWERQGDTLPPPRVLCEHRSHHGWQRGHAHPVLHPDGRRVLFTSNRSEYGNLYLADVPDALDALPEAGID